MTISKSLYKKYSRFSCCDTFLFKWHVRTPKYLFPLPLVCSETFTGPTHLYIHINISSYILFNLQQIRVHPTTVTTEILKNAAIQKCHSVFTLKWKQPPNFYASLISVWILAFILFTPLSEAIWSLCSNKPKMAVIWIQGFCCLLLLSLLLLLLLKVQLHKYLILQNIPMWPPNITHTYYFIKGKERKKEKGKAN